MKISLRNSFLFFSIIMVVISAALIIIINFNQTKKEIIEIEERHAQNDLELLYTSIENSYVSFEAYKQNLTIQKKQEAKNIIDATISSINTIYQKQRRGLLSQADAQRLAIDIVRDIRFNDSTGYIWINDLTLPIPRMIMHPINPDLDGKILSDTAFYTTQFSENLFAKGNELVREMGMNFLRYKWYKPQDTSKTMCSKVSYFRLFKPWGWVLGSGVYFDDLEKMGIERKKEILADLKVNIDELQEKRENKNNYFFIFQSDKMMLIHPYLQDNQISQYVNPLTGNKILDDIMQATKRENEKVDYIWEKPNDLGSFSYNKRLFVKYHAPLDLYICSSFYLDDVDDKTYQIQLKIIYVSIVVIFIIILIAFPLSKFISNPVKQLNEMAQAINEKDIKPLPVQEKGFKETQEITLIMNRLLNSISRHMDEKQNLFDDLQSANEHQQKINAKLKKRLLEISQLQKDRRLFFDLVENTKDIILLIDKDYKITYANSSFRTLFDVHAIDSNLHIKEVFTDENYSSIMKVISIANTYGSWTDELQIEIDSQKMDFSLLAFLGDNENSKSENFFLILRDVSDIRTAEDQVQETERKFRAVFDDSPALIGLLDESYKLLDANSTALSIIDKSLKDVVNLNFADTEWWDFDEDQRQKLIKALEKSKEGEIVTLEVQHKGRHGDVEYVNLSIRPIYDQNSELIYILVVGLPITEQKKIEIKLKNSEEFYRSIIDASTDVVSILSLEGNILFESPAHENVLGYPKGYLVGKNGFDYIHPDDRDLLLEKFQKLVEMPNSSAYIKFRYKNFLNEYVVLEGSGKNMLHNPAINGIIVNYRDITEKEIANSNFKDTQEMYRAIYENSDLGMMLLTESDGFIACNKATLDLFSFSSEQEFINKFPWDISPEYQSDGQRSENKAVRMIRIALENGYHSFDWVHKKDSGSIFHVRVSLAKIELNNRKNALLATIQDYTEQILKEISLNEKQERYNKLFNQSPFSIQIYDSNGFVIQSNDSWAKLWNLPPDFVDFEFNCLTDPQLQKFGFTDLIKKAYEGEVVKLNEYEFDPSKSGVPGKKAILNTIIYPLKNESEQVENIVVIHEELTDIKKNQEKEEKTEEMFKDILQNSPLPMIIVNNNGNIEFLSESFTELLGYTLEDIPNTDYWWQKAYPDNKQRQEFIIKWNEITKKAHSERINPEPITLPTTTKWGKELIIKFFGAPVADKNLLILNDITKQYKQEIVLSNNEEKLKTIIQGSNIGTWDWSFNENSITVSDKFREILGYDNSELKYIDRIAFINLIHEDDRTKFMNNLNNHINDLDQQFGTEVRLKTASSSYKWVMFRGKITERNEDESAKMMLGTLSDINNLKVAENEIRHLNRDLELIVDERTKELVNVNKELNQFAYIVSHDLKAPLRGISQIANWLLEDYAQALDEEGKELNMLLMSRVSRMSDLIDGILEYSRVGRSKLEIAEVDLDTTVRNIIEMLSAPENIDITIDSQLPVINADGVKIGQVFQNLISNAIKHMDRDDGKIIITHKEDDTHWHFSVKDNGIGIDPKYHDRIFGIFQTLKSKEESESTGIGLTIVKKIIENAGGDIWLESQVNEGATFHFTIEKVEMQNGE